MGSVLAIIGGALLSALVLAIVHGILPSSAHDAASVGYTGEDRGDNLLGILPLHAPFRDSLQLLLVMHGVGFHVQYTSNANSFVYTYSHFSPLNGLLLLPALLLVFGGYLAACTDFQNRFSTSLWRGAAIAMPYTILLFILASQVNGPVLEANGATSAAYNQTLNMDTLMLLLFSLLWGALFGMVGASLKVARGQWHRMVHTFLRANPRPQLSGVVVGGLAATGLGLALTLLTLYSFVAYTLYSSPLIASAACTTTDWQTLTLWSIAQGPIHAVNVFAFSLGAPVTFVNQAQGQQACFYTYTPHATLSLLDATLHSHPWVYALLLIPALSLFMGGRASVAASRVRGMGPAAIQGALIALPFTVCMIILVLISAISNVSTNSSTTTTNSTFVQSVSVGVLNMLLWALLSGAFFGLLGGIYQISPIKGVVRSILTALALPFRVMCGPLYVALDRVSGQSRLVTRSPARTLLYSALLIGFVLAIVAGVAGALLINSNQFFTFDDNQRIRDILSVLVIALPGLLLLCSVATAFSTDPLPASQPNYIAPPATTMQVQRGF
ncbi:MAG: hypothetical protein NVSMB38_39800 [Ktedonobacteraceae bacterium]